MSHPEEPRIDFASLARKLRAKGSLIQLEATNLQQQGKDDDAERLAAPAQELMAMAEALEEWRRAHADKIRLAAVSIVSQRFALETFERGDGPDDLAERKKPYFREAADMTSGAAQALEEIAQQLDPRRKEDNPHE